MFTGFNEKTTEFLWGIRFNNERVWFLENKQNYMDHLQTPMRALADEVWTCFTEKTKLDLNFHVARIHRDVRRVRDGRPYKENLWFSLERDHDDEWTAEPGFFFEITPEGYSYGMGFFAASASTMKKFRGRLDANPAEFERIALALGKNLQIYGDEYSRPKGEKEGVLAKWYNRKTIGLIAEDKGHEKLYAPKFAKALCDEFVSLVPLYEFLRSLEGDSPEGDANG
jgi:uncharacterized protein (TIGR02453 family)